MPHRRASVGDGISLTARIRVGGQIVFRELGEELVLLNLQTGVYFGLDPVGTRVWGMLDAAPSLQRVLDVLLGEYEVEPDRCQSDLLELVAALRANRLVEVLDAAAG